MDGTGESAEVLKGEEQNVHVVNWMKSLAQPHTHMLATVRAFDSFGFVNGRCRIVLSSLRSSEVVKLGTGTPSVT
jgi:hypothetical protein